MADATATRTTVLHALHLAAGAKMGPFAGYDMPLYYKDGVVAEHEWTRSQAGIFDVSHMGQVMIEGPGAAAFLERITPSAFAALPQGRAKYTVLTTPTGGIVDDLIVTRAGADSFFAVINAGCKEKDIEWMARNLPADVRLTRLDDRALVAVQGPKAEAALRDAFGLETADMPYMWMQPMRLSAAAGGTDVLVSRLGYTGEDGFEISVPFAAAPKFWEVLCAHAAVKPVGLAARDSLRLEMGYPLYGHDIDETTNPVEAGLSWVMGKENAGFIGADAVLPHLKSGPHRMRVGIVLKDKGIAREGAEIRSADGAVIGRLTSGGFSPTLKSAIGQGYVDAAFAAPGTALNVIVRDRAIAAETAPMPFIPAKTKSMKKQAA